MLGRRGNKEAKPPRPLPGTRIGNYVVVKLLGHGGMGEVYLVEHPDIGTKAAVKVLGSRFSSMAHASERFKAEARAIARIKHTNVVEIHDYGALEDGRLYYQMEHLEGEVLQELMERRGKMNPEEIAPYLDQICAGLSAAHAKQIVHRDLKPENIIVNAGPPMTLKILDFGIAKLLETQPGSANTSVGVLLGTPIVMAPEQAAGQPERISFRTDLYSLGVILYWMLTGNPPFLDDAPGMLVSRHINDTPRLLLDVDPTLPAGVATLVERCLAKDPLQRPASALEVAAEFSEALLWQPSRPATPAAEDKTGLYITGPGPLGVPAQLPAPPPIPDEEDAESSAKTAVLPRLDVVPEGANVEEVPTLRDDHDVKTMFVGEVQPKRRPLAWLVFAIVAVILGVGAGVALSIAGDDAPRPDAGAGALALAADAGAADPDEVDEVAAPKDERDPVTTALPPDTGAPDASAPATPPAAPRTPDVALAPAATPDLGPVTWGRPKKVHRRRPTRRRWRRPRRRVKPRPRPPEKQPTVVKKAPPPPAKVMVNVSSLDRRQNFVTANIYLDGKYMGQTPLVMRNVTAGIHLVEARQKGYKRSSKQVRFVPGKVNHVVMNLRK